MNRSLIWCHVRRAVTDHVVRATIRRRLQQRQQQRRRATSWRPAVPGRRPPPWPPSTRTAGRRGASSPLPIRSAIRHNRCPIILTAIRQQRTQQPTLPTRSRNRSVGVTTLILSSFFYHPSEYQQRYDVFQYGSQRVPTAASPSNTNSSSSSNTGSQSGTMSTSLSNTVGQSGNNQEQLSKTNLYIRGLTQSTTDKDLVSMCAQ